LDLKCVNMGRFYQELLWYCVKSFCSIVSPKNVSYKSRLYVAGERAIRGHRFLFRYVDSLLLDTLTAKVIVSNISDII
jgi:hypothetical protein